MLNPNQLVSNKLRVNLQSRIKMLLCIVFKQRVRKYNHDRRQECKNEYNALVSFDCHKFLFSLSGIEQFCVHVLSQFM
jgi:hypothetical protein